MKTRPFLAAVIVSAFVPIAPAFAAEAENEHAKSLRERDVALGDFDGARTALEDHGVTFGLLYTQEYLGVAAGGLRRAGEYNGLLQLDLDLDLEKAVGWKGGLIHATGFAGWGQSISGQWIGDDSNVSNINIRNGTRLFEAYLQQSFGELFSLRVGLLATDSEFYASDITFAGAAGGTLFVNSDFGAIPILSFNVPEPIFPSAGPGVSLTFTPTESLTFRTAIYDGQPLPSDGLDDRNPHGLQPRLSAEDGALILAEVQYEWNRPAKQPEPTPGGKEIKAVVGPALLGGTLRLGGFYHTGDFIRWDTGATTHGLAGGWLSVDQMLWRENAEDSQGLCAFVRVSGAPRDRSVLEWGIDAGFDYIGLIPGRNDDTLGLGVSAKRYSRDFDRSERAAGNAARDHETIIEATYRAALTPWLAVQPDVQYVIHPAGSDSADNALVVGLRVAITF